MFYETAGPHGLPHNPFKALVIPRPIGWVSTLSSEGVVNLAPFSYFNGVADRPPVVILSFSGQHVEGGAKDTLSNIEASGEFVVNMVTEQLTDAMNTTCADLPRDVDELALAGLTAAPSRLVKPPRVAESPAHLECKYLQTVNLPADDPANPNTTVFGQVIGVHISEEILTDGLVDFDKYRALARLGYMDYSVVDNHFTLLRPNPAN
jgi:flavin reductase (DIM6/NTAB) family NADH-FMN oxidoreductase RutF